MGDLYKRKIKVVSLKDSFFDLFKDGSDDQILQVKPEHHKRPCLILIKTKYKGRNYTFALPFRSNISKSAPKHTYHPLATNFKTKEKNRHGLHYIKALPVDSTKYFNVYIPGGNFKDEFVLAQVEKELPDIIEEFNIYLRNYEVGVREKFCVDIDNAIIKQNLDKNN